MTPLKSLSYFVFPFSRYSMLKNKTKTTESFHKEKEYSQQKKNIQDKSEVGKGKVKKSNGTRYPSEMGLKLNTVVNCLVRHKQTK